MPAGDDYAVGIIGRFMRDLEGMGGGMKSQVLEAVAIGDDALLTEVIELQEADIQRRLDMAVDSAAWQGYQVGRVDAIAEASDWFNWVLDPGADHCNTCIKFALEGPYLFANLPGIPGDAPTDCDGGCRCDLVPARAPRGA